VSNIRARVLIVVAIATTLVLSACSGSGGSRSGSTGASAATAGANAGVPGKAVHLVVGYQPYYTEAWTALVLRGTGLWKKYLPAGSTVDFQVGLQGSILVAQMLAGKQQIGYMGDMPAIVGTSKRSVADLRIVADIGNSADQCGAFMVRKGAPAFSSQAEAVKWASGKTVATPQGSCADRVAQTVFGGQGSQPKSYLNQSIDLITSDFQRGSVDAAAVWEPSASKLVNDGLAQRVASGDFAGVDTAAFLVMPEQLIKNQPDIAKDWLRAELAAERYLADPANATAIVNMAVAQTQGYTAKDMHDALYRTWSPALGGAPDGVKLTLPFTIGTATQSLIASDAAFLYKIKTLASPTLPAGAVDGSIAQSVLSSDGGSSPVGVVRGTGGGQ
jgi:NitT/TauT family transport system substrate-binding protein